jgi:predicted ATPase/class 3 adenylate cyclase
LFTDIEGSTLLLERLGRRAYAEVLADHHRLIRAGVSAHGGREVDTQGDSFFVVFPSASGSVAAAIEIQLALEAHRWAGGERVRVRMGLHAGEASETTTGMVGYDVHRAARVAATAHGGQILLSETAAALVRESLPEGVSLKDLGHHRLKDLRRAQQIFQLTADGLASDFPPLRSLDSPLLPNNLPAQLASFIGRDEELGEVRALVESSRLVTLTGAGGAGKTRLALQVAAELLDGSGDGVWLVELAPVADDDAVPRAIAQALGITAPPGRAALDVLLDAVAPQELLVVLDNCEHLTAACAMVVDAVLGRCPKVSVLATSREPLGLVGERIYRVPSLSLPGSEMGSGERSDAVELFAARAREQGAGFVIDEETAPLVESICRRLDGMPLAIELAAARLRSLSLRTLSERLDQRFRLLTGGSRSALPRQQTLQATVQWSYSLLDAREQAVLRALSVFVDGFDLEAAEAVCERVDVESLDVLDVLGSLVDKSLVGARQDQETVRYGLLETIRQFAAERLLDSGESTAAAVANAHCAYFIALAQEAGPHLIGPDQGRWLARLGADHANLRRAIERASADPAKGARVVRALVSLERYWWIGSRGMEVTSILLDALERPDVANDPALLARGLMVAARGSIFLDVESALRRAGQAVEVASQIDDERILTDALCASARVHTFAGRLEQGYRLAQEALERARSLGDGSVLMEALGAAALYTLHESETDPGKGRELLNDALVVARRMGDSYMAAMLHNNASVLALSMGDVQAAREHLEKAEVCSAAVGVTIYNVSISMGMVQREEGDHEGAAARLRAALITSRRTRDRFGLAYAALGLALRGGGRRRMAGCR